MRQVRGSLRATSLVAVLVLAGCAPTFAGSPFGNGVQLGISSGGGLNIASPYCSLTGMQSAEAGVVRTAGASMAFSIMQLSLIHI